jgi:hypothetical protein
MDIFIKCLNLSYIILGSCFIGYKIKNHHKEKTQTIDE